MYEVVGLRKMYYQMLEKLRKAGIVEGISLIVLFFVAMPVKYLMGEPVLVRIFGTIHGLLWLYLLYTLYQVYKANLVEKETAVKIVIASVIPFGFLFIDKTVKQYEHLAQ
jgi:integral membrane protein